MKERVLQPNQTDFENFQDSTSYIYENNLVLTAGKKMFKEDYSWDLLMS